MISKIRVI